MRRSPHGYYRHYKDGTLYRMLNDSVTLEADGTRMVHYKREKEPSETLHRTFVRPYDEFFGEVEAGKQRFEPIMSMADLKPKEPEKPKPTLMHILEKGAEYYQCARHIHPRGASAVMRETETLVRILRDDGKTFDDLLALIAEQNKNGNKPDVDGDLFLQHVKKLFAGVA